jgi:steroid 5-alpha reductase family enzyme
VTFGPLLCVAFLAVWGVAVSVADANLAAMFFINGVLQLALFSTVAIVPFIKTGRMSFVDIAWPFGVALIGIQILLMGDGDFIRKACVAGVYLLIGLRMGIGALTMARTTGVIIRTEFPRYTYRRMKLSLKGESGIRLHMGAEILAQGFANASVLAIPGFLMAVNSDGQLHLLELAGALVWFIAYLLESTADLQKLNFMSKNKGGVCNVGLWRYSRHPNYFAEWLVWTGIVIASIPSWLALQGGDVNVASAVLGIGGLGASVMMYITLVYLTGAIPSEYYSVRKRPKYKHYQETTNMFFPWFPKK